MSSCIAASLGLGAGIGYATSIPIEASVAVLGLVAIGFIAHAMFVNGPVDRPEELTDEIDPEEVPQVLSPVESAD